VLADYYRALGRIGTPEAVQALARVAQTQGGFLRRRSSAARVVAVEALGQAGGAPALRTLEALKNDGDKAVRSAVEKALGAAAE
jgi:HEAT repeat protein